MQKLFSAILFVIIIALPAKIFSQTLTPAKQENDYGTNSATRENIVDFARGFLGIPYRYASAAPEKGFDCSGFVHFIFKNFNIDVPHSSKAIKNIGTIVKPDDFKVGDILIFYSYKNLTQIGHVGIICEAAGMNSKFIHSSSGKIKGVVISELNSASYAKRFYQCIDIIGNE